MSRGLGIEQRAILLAAAGRLTERWSRMELQQAAWGRLRGDYKLTWPGGHSRSHHWVKNVRWWRGDKALTEGNFSRALRSLERRGLLRAVRAPGCHTSWHITALGLEQVRQLSPP
jgi:hypothetical protein